MKRSKSIQLMLVSAIPFALVACDDGQRSVQQSVRTVTDQRTFETVQSCVDSKIPADICADTFMAAMDQHKKQAPVYDTQANCEADFIPGYCAEITGGRFMPKLGGFQITSEREVPNQPAGAEGQMVQSGAGSHSGGGSNDGLLTGLLLGQMMSGGSARYYSEPVYISRDSRGDFRKSTLAKQIESGNTFSRSRQSTQGAGYSVNSLARKSSNLNSKPVQVAAAPARGGFGGQATARSGWGGLGSFGG